MFRTALTLLYRSILFMILGAAIVVASFKYGPALFAQTLPQDLRPHPSEIAEMTPQRIMDALRDIRGVLD